MCFVHNETADINTLILIQISKLFCSWNRCFGWTRLKFKLRFVWVCYFATAHTATIYKDVSTVVCVICQAELWPLWRDIFLVKVECEELPWSMTASENDKSITHSHTVFESSPDVDWNLKHGSRDKMNDILQTTFLNSYSCMIIVEDS